MVRIVLFPRLFPYGLSRMCRTGRKVLFWVLKEK